MTARKLYFLPLILVAACSEEQAHDEALARPASGLETAEAPLSWVTVHEATTEGGATLRIQVTNRALAAFPELPDQMGSEERTIDADGVEVVLGGAWTMGPQGTELVDPWRVELSWAPESLTVSERQTLTVVTEAEEGGWRPALAEVDASAGRAVVYATDLGVIGLVAGDAELGLGAPPATAVATVPAIGADLDAGAADVRVDTLGGDKAIQAILFRVHGAPDPGNTVCLSVDAGTYTVPFKSGDRYQVFVNLDVPNFYEFTAWQSSSPTCAPVVGEIWPANFFDVVVAGYTMPRASCTATTGPMNVSIASASSAIRGGTATCPVSTGTFGVELAFKAGSFTTPVTGGNSVCADINGATSVASLVSGAYRVKAYYFLPLTFEFRFWESTTSACGDVVQEFFPDNATVQVQATAMPDLSCIDRTGGTPPEKSFEVDVTFSSGPIVSVTGPLPCVEECGNSVVETGEECDDGNNDDNDGCSATCQTEECGDGIQQLSEDCDDGNVLNGDGCSAACTVDATECYDFDVSFQSASPLDTDDTSTWADRWAASCGGSGRGDIAYYWRAPHPGFWEFTSVGSANEAVLSIYPGTGGTCGAEIDCANPSGDATVGQNADYGEEFVVVIDGDVADGAVTLAINPPVIPPSMTITGPTSGDTRTTLRGSNFWNAGDNVTMTRPTSYATITGLTIHLVISPNTLTLTRCSGGVATQTSNVIINGVTVGQFVVGVGDTAVDETFSFAGISGTSFVIEFETATTNGTGCGSAGFSNTGSTITLIQ